MQVRIENVENDADLEEVYDSERHLLYLACTRARSSVGDWREASIRFPWRLDGMNPAARRCAYHTVETAQ
jgi:hypothetical protein